MVVITPREEVQKYFDDKEYLNQSSLKNLLKGYENFMAKLNMDLSKKEFIIIGKAVDALLTAGSEDFEKEFYISLHDDSISEAVEEILELVLKLIEESEPSITDIGTLEANSPFVEKALNVIPWNKGWKPETRIKKIIEAGRLRFEAMKNSRGKIVLSKSQYTLVTTIVNSLKTNFRTAQYFDTNNKEENIILAYQYPIYGELEGVKCKGLLDLAVIFLKEGKVKKIIPVDLKTSHENTIDFPKAMKSFRYDIQAAWYTDLLLSPGTKHPEWVPEFHEDFEVANFQFIVESTTTPGIPLIFQLDDSALHGGRTGHIDARTGAVFYLGYTHGLEDYKYYQKQGWKQNKLLDDNIILKVNYKYEIID